MAEKRHDAFPIEHLSDSALCGQCTQLYRLSEELKLIAYQRWDKGGSGNDVVVVANFLNEPQEDYVIGFPSAGTWKLRFNSDWQGYSDAFEGLWTGELARNRASATASPSMARFTSPLKRIDFFAMSDRKSARVIAKSLCDQNGGYERISGLLLKHPSDRDAAASS